MVGGGGGGGGGGGEIPFFDALLQGVDGIDIARNSGIKKLIWEISLTSEKLVSLNSYLLEGFSNF